MKYETPEIEFTKFEVDTKIMAIIIPGGDDDRQDPTIPIGDDDWISIDDLPILDEGF